MMEKQMYSKPEMDSLVTKINNDVRAIKERIPISIVIPHDLFRIERIIALVTDVFECEELGNNDYLSYTFIYNRILVTLEIINRLIDDDNKEQWFELTYVEDDADNADNSDNSDNHDDIYLVKQSFSFLGI